MNRQQLNYAMDRAKGLYKEAKEKLDPKFRDYGKALERAERLAALRAGRFTIRPKSSYCNWWDCIVFTEEVDATFDKKGYDKALAPITAAFNKLTDELVLGDDEKALALLAAFANLVGCDPVSAAYNRLIDSHVRKMATRP